MTELNWQWWAGSNDEEYRLAGPCKTKEIAIDEAYGCTDPGDTIHLIEAVTGEYDEYEDLYEFSHTRNRESVIRTEDE